MTERAASHILEAGKLAEFANALYPLLAARADEFGILLADTPAMKDMLVSGSAPGEAELEEGLALLARAGLIKLHRSGGRRTIVIADFDNVQTGPEKRTLPDVADWDETGEDTNPSDKPPVEQEGKQEADTLPLSTAMNGVREPMDLSRQGRRNGNDTALQGFETSSPDRRLYPVVNSDGASPGTSSYLRAYGHVLIRRWWTVLTVTLVLTTLVAIFSFRMQPVYEATARIEVEAETPQIQSLNDLSRIVPSDNAFLATQVKVIESDHLAWKTIQQLGLREKPEFAAPDKAGEWRKDPVAGQVALIRTFRNHLRVALMRNSRMVEVSFRSSDPNLAAQVANALVGNYLEYNFHKKYNATREASRWMEQQLDELKAKVEKSQQALVDYERESAIVNINEKQNVLEQRLADLSKDLTTAQSDRMQKEALHDLLNSSESRLAFVAQNELLQRLEEKHADLKGQYIEAHAQYGPNFPKVMRLRDQVNEIQSIIDRERKRVGERIRNDYLAAVGRERLLSRIVAEAKAAVGKLNQLLIQHNILRREFETNQELYDNLLQRLKDATVSAGLRATNIHVVDQALAPAVPVRPRKLFNTCAGLVVGLILGVAFAFVRESLDASINAAEVVERLTAVPVLAVIPAANSLRPRPSWLRRRGSKLLKADGKVELAVLERPASALAEAYRTLRTSILLSTAPRPPQTLLVTSPQSNEGKTCTSLNLALSLAQRCVPVLLIDADLRKPGVALALGLAEEKGLSGLLTGAHGLEEAILKVEASPNLCVLPAGPRPPNPADLLSSPTMEELLRELAGRFEYLVLDSPPLLIVTDAVVLSPLVDGVLLVIECGRTTCAALVRAHRILENAQARVLGGVFNKTDLRRNGSYGSYYQGYYDSYYREGPAKERLENRVLTG